ncbi:hypothetical protein ACOME3_009172 [Neoechinorhynchus agilis]
MEEKQNINTKDPDLPPCSKAPVDVQEDVRSTERRRRVSSALECKPFRNDLESIVKHGVLLNQQPKDDYETLDRFRLLPDLNYTTALSRMLIPIDDIHRFNPVPSRPSEQNILMGPDEILLRCKVASLCRLIDSLYDEIEVSGDRLCNTHVTARLNESEELFLVNPYGLMLCEITARSLLKVDAAGNIINEDGSRSHGTGDDGLIVYNRASFAIHAAIHRTRYDVQCIVHLHHLAVITVSCLKTGLLPLCREALFLGGISYHDQNDHPTTIDNSEDIQKILCEELGPFNKVLIWRNHGMSICGESVQDAWQLIAKAIKACKVQCGAMMVGLENLNVPNTKVQREMVEVSRSHLSSLQGEHVRGACEYEFEAAMRWLDMIGLKTGYRYKYIKPVLPWECSSQCAARGDSSFTRYQQISIPSSPSEYCFSPNSYVKKSSNSWTKPTVLSVSEVTRIPTIRPALKLNSKPFVGSPDKRAELEERCRQLHEKRAHAIIDPGPSGAIMRRSNETPNLPPPNVPATILMGAASLAIVKRSEQKNPSVYRSELSNANPFKMMNTNDAQDQASLNGNNCNRVSSEDDEIVVIGVDNVSESKEISKKKTSFRTPSFLKKRKGMKKENVPAARV